MGGSKRKERHRRRKPDRERDESASISRDTHHDLHLRYIFRFLDRDTTCEHGYNLREIISALANLLVSNLPGLRVQNFIMVNDTT